MAEAVMNFSVIKPHLQSTFPAATKPNLSSFTKPVSKTGFGNGRNLIGGSNFSKRGSLCKANAFFDWPLMAMMVEHSEGQRDLITIKSIWHLSDKAIKNVYTFYIMFTVWGCCFFSATKDPFYDSESYRGDGGDGTGHWVYEKQEDIEEENRASLWREELIEEIEQKVGGLKELEEAGRK